MSYLKVKMDCPYIKGKPEHDTEEDKEICLNCPLYPLPCVHEFEVRRDKPNIKRAKAVRNAEIRNLSDEGKTTRELAKEFRLSERTIQGITQKNAKKVA